MTHKIEAEQLLWILERSEGDTKTERAQIHATLAVADAIREQTAVIKEQAQVVRIDAP